MVEVCGGWCAFGDRMVSFGFLFFNFCYCGLEGLRENGPLVVKALGMNGY